MAKAQLPPEFLDVVAHHLRPEQPVGPEGGRPRVGHPKPAQRWTRKPTDA